MNSVLDMKKAPTNLLPNNSTVQAGQPSKTTERLIVPLSEIPSSQIRWLWYPYLQANNLTILRGNGGVGKSFFAAALMSAVSNGKQDPFMPGSLVSNGNVIYFGMEDDDFVMKERVRNAGGDLTKIFYNQDYVTLSDTGALSKMVVSHQAKLLIFDPIQSYLGAGIDMNRANQIRPILDGLRQVARETSCAIMFIEHLNKATQQNALYRGIGTVDFVNACRSVLMLGYHPREEDARVCIQIKTNSKRGSPISFKIDGDGSFIWNGETNVAEEEIMSATGVFSQSNSHDPLLEGIKVLMKDIPYCWEGTAADLFAAISKVTGRTVLTPEAIGKKMPTITPQLNRLGFEWNKSRVRYGMKYSIFHSSSIGPLIHE